MQLTLDLGQHEELKPTSPKGMDRPIGSQSNCDFVPVRFAITEILREQAVAQKPDFNRILNGAVRDLKFGTQNAQRKIKSFGNNVKRAKNSVQKAWNDSAGTRRKIKQGVGRAIDTAKTKWHQTEKFRRELPQNLKSSARKVGEFAAKTKRFIAEKAPEFERAKRDAERWIKVKSEHAKQFYYRAKNDYGPKIASAISNPDNQRKAMEAVGKLIEIKRQFDAAKFDATFKTIKLAGRIPIVVNGQTLTLEELAKQKILEKHPYLAGTSLATNPAVALTHLVEGDRDYLFNELPLVESKNGKPQTLRQAMIQSSRIDIDQTMRVLAVMEAAESVDNTLSTGEGGIKACEDVLYAIQRVSASPRR